MSTSRLGIFFVFAAFSLWGLFPLYWKLLVHVPAAEILCHRIIWSAIFLLGINLAIQGRSFLKSMVAGRDVLLRCVVSGALVGANWLIYIFAVNQGFVLEASLGYFINPLLNVALGVFFLQERLRRAQLLALLLAGAGVAIRVVAYGAVPWIALGLAFTLGVYGLLQKQYPLPAVRGLGLETLLLTPLALAFLTYRADMGELAFWHVNLQTDLLLVSGGIVTTIPLLCFGAGVKLIPLRTVGMIQYISPTLQFLVAVGVYSEHFGSVDLVSFSFIWCALALYTVEGLVSARAGSAALAAVPQRS